MAKKVCSIEGCETSAIARGWCWMHYQRNRRHGSPTATILLTKIDPAVRFATKWVETANGCWTWTAGVFSHGYPAFHDGVKLRQGHRYSYELHVGPIPDGLTLDHLCYNRRCVNPAHLEPCTLAENIRRSHRRRRFLAVFAGSDDD